MLTLCPGYFSPAASKALWVFGEPITNCQSWLTHRLCSLPGSSVHGILQTRILLWGSHSHLQGIFPTQGSNLQPLKLYEFLLSQSLTVKVGQLTDFVVWQAPLSMGSSRQEYCCGEAIPIYRGSSRPGIEPGSPALQADSLSFGPNTGEKGSPCLPGFPGQEEKWKAISTGCGKCHEDGAAQEH